MARSPREGGKKDLVLQNQVSQVVRCYTFSHYLGRRKCVMK